MSEYVSEKREVVCAECGVKSSSLETARVHRKLHHTVGEEHPCEQGGGGDSMGCFEIHTTHSLIQIQGGSVSQILCFDEVATSVCWGEYQL